MTSERELVSYTEVFLQEMAETQQVVYQEMLLPQFQGLDGRSDACSSSDKEWGQVFHLPSPDNKQVSDTSLIW